MGTRSRIGIEHLNGTIESIYCHWDGYFDWNGKMLHDAYQDINKIKSLIKLGNISALRENVEPIHEGHDFEAPHEDVVIAYGRDREETGQEALVSESRESFLERCGKSGEEFVYLFVEKENQWLASEIEISNYDDLTTFEIKLNPLTEALEEYKPSLLDNTCLEI